MEQKWVKNHKITVFSIKQVTEAPKLKKWIIILRYWSGNADNLNISFGIGALWSYGR